jgi:hypothetical protein
VSDFSHDREKVDHKNFMKLNDRKKTKKLVQGVLTPRGFWGKQKTVNSESVNNEDCFSTKTPKRGKNFFKVHFSAILHLKMVKTVKI